MIIRRNNGCDAFILEDALDLEVLKKRGHLRPHLLTFFSTSHPLREADLYLNGENNYDTLFQNNNGRIKLTITKNILTDTEYSGSYIPEVNGSLPFMVIYLPSLKKEINLSLTKE